MSEQTPAVVRQPASFDPHDAGWLNQRLRLYTCLLRDSRKLLWERVRESGPERIRRQRQDGDQSVMERLWDSERTYGSPLVTFTDEEGDRKSVV